MMKNEEIINVIFENYNTYVKLYDSHVESYGKDHILTQGWKARALALDDLLTDLTIEHAPFCYMIKED